MDKLFTSPTAIARFLNTGGFSLWYCEEISPRNRHCPKVGRSWVLIEMPLMNFQARCETSLVLHGCNKLVQWNVHCFMQLGMWPKSTTSCSKPGRYSEPRLVRPQLGTRNRYTCIHTQRRVHACPHKFWCIFFVATKHEPLASMHATIVLDRLPKLPIVQNLESGYPLVEKVVLALRTWIVVHVCVPHYKLMALHIAN
jgi:hypothetical protein